LAGTKSLGDYVISKRSPSTQQRSVKKLKEIEVRNQTELDAAIKSDHFPICIGSKYFGIYDSATVRAYDSATVTAYDSATVRAYGSATVRAYDSATVRAYDSATVRAYGSATVRAYDSATVTAYDSATVTASGSATVTASGSATVTAYDSATVRAYDSATVTASGYVPVIVKAKHKCKITGGRVIEFPLLDTIEKWCEFYGLEIVDGIVTLYKAVGDDYKSARGADYSPGNSPVASDWDGGIQECGKGLHFSPNPMMTLEFVYDSKKFCGCPVKVSELSVHPNGEYPQKVKAKGCGPCFEVNIDGEPI
jgi:hypothetical protein